MPTVTGNVYERALINGVWKDVFIPNAIVEVSAMQGNRKIEYRSDTELTGRYKLRVPPGSYDIKVSRDGYLTQDSRYGGEKFQVGTEDQHSDIWMETGTSPVVKFKKPVKLDVILQIPGLTGDDIYSGRDIPSRATIDVALGTLKVDNVSNYRQTGDFEFTANVKSHSGAYNVETGHGTLTLDADMTPGETGYGGKITLSNVALSTMSTSGSFEGKPLTARSKRLILVGEVAAKQDGVWSPINKQTVRIKVLVKFDDAAGLTQA